MSSRERLIKNCVIEKRFLKCRSRKEIRKEGGREGGKKRREKETWEEVECWGEGGGGD